MLAVLIPIGEVCSVDAPEIQRDWDRHSFTEDQRRTSLPGAAAETSKGRHGSWSKTLFGVQHGVFSS